MADDQRPHDRSDGSELRTRRSRSRRGGRKAPASSNRRGGIIALVSVAVILLALVGAGVWAVSTYGPRISEALGGNQAEDYEGPGGEEVLFTVEAGDDGSSVANRLVEQGITASYDAFYDIIVADPDFALYPGTYELREQMSAAAAYEVLSDQDNLVTSTVLVREGESIDQIAAALETASGASPEDVQQALDDPSAYGLEIPASRTEGYREPLEGYLFPATYSFEPETPVTDMVQRMVDRMLQELDELGVPAEERHRVLTEASLIEREVNREEDYPRVARVIENRIAASQPLQFDSTSHYGAGGGSGTVFTSDEERAADNPYNTYVIEGLPVGPIASPGSAAIAAAMSPAEGDWLYFVVVNHATGETAFNETYAEHLRDVEVGQQWCQANPDYSC